MKKLLIGGKGCILRCGRQGRRPIPSQDVLHDRDGLDHRDIAIADRGNEAGGIDRQELGIVLDPGQEVHVPEPIRQPHLLQQPDDPETSALSKHCDHRLRRPRLSAPKDDCP